MAEGTSSGYDRDPQRVFDGYIAEYEECGASYRHTYSTIWQAGGLFGVISGALIAVGSTEGGGIDPLIQVLAPLPFLFWYLGIFRPMNKYGEWRSERLVDIETKLEELEPELDMRHFRRYDRDRKDESALYRWVTFKWIWQPRVSEIVTIFGMSVLVAEIVLIWVNYL